MIVPHRYYECMPGNVAQTTIKGWVTNQQQNNITLCWIFRSWVMKNICHDCCCGSASVTGEVGRWSGADGMDSYCDGEDGPKLKNASLKQHTYICLIFCELICFVILVFWLCVTKKICHERHALSVIYSYLFLCTHIGWKMFFLSPYF